jgi:Major Facilitator Superfamily
MAKRGIELFNSHLTLSGPAESALFAVMLSRELRQELNGWSLGLQETGRLVSPLFGAGLFALVGGGTVSVFDAITFVTAAVMLSRIRLREARRVPQPRHWRADLLAGFAHIRRTPELRRLLTAASVVMSFSAVLVAAQYSLVQGVGEPPSFLGVFSAGLGAGSIVASMVSGRLLRSAGERWLAVLGMANFALGNATRNRLASAGNSWLSRAWVRAPLAVPRPAQPGAALHAAGTAGPGVRCRHSCLLRPRGPAPGARRPGHPLCHLPAALPSWRGHRSGHRDRLHLDRPTAALA